MFVRKEWFSALIILVVANIVIFWQFYLKHSLPFPGDLLVSFFFPWNSGGFTGFDPWTTHKDVIAADVIRQIYPWKTLVIDQLKSGQWPLWNPYNFSGTPLLANLQSSVFFPGNILFFILPKLWAWIGLVIGLPFLFSIFTYFYLKSLKVSNLAAIFGAVVSSNISYFLVWSEQLVIIQSALFLPVCLWIINRRKYVFLLPVFLALSIFGGHIQTAVYVYIIVTVYALANNVNWLRIFVILLISLGVAAVQLFPSAELYLLSAREAGSNKELFLNGIFPWNNFVTFFVPDFFGNPATKNFTGRNYGDFQLFIGVVAGFFAFLGGLLWPTQHKVRPFIILLLLAVLFSTFPGALALFFSNIPVLSSGVAARMMFIAQFSGVVLAVFGLEYWLQSDNRNKRIWLITGLFGVSLLFLGLKAPRNTFLSGAVFCGVVGLFILKNKVPKIVVVCFLLALAVTEYSYFFNKFSPFAPERYVFPQHPVMTFLKNQAGLDRFYGFGTAYVDNNFSTQFRSFAVEGYDSLYIKRYGELLGSSSRSDAIVSNKDDFYRNRLFDLLGVKYILDKNDNPTTNWEPETGKFPPDKYELTWQSFKWKAYERKTAFPRTFLAGNYIIESVPNEIIKKLYSTDLSKTLILEEEPVIKPEQGGIEKANIVSYQPGNVSIETQSEKPKILFLSDSFFPGWKAYVDNKPMKLLRADYSLRAVPLTAGKHIVIMRYDPESFKYGLIVSVISIGILLILLKKNDQN